MTDQISFEVPPPGSRIRLLFMPDDPDPIPPGTCGIVTTYKFDWSTVNMPELGIDVGIEWDIDRGLNLIIPRDQWEYAEDDEAASII